MTCHCARGDLFEFVSVFTRPYTLSEGLRVLRAELCPFVSAHSAILWSSISWIRRLCAYSAMGHQTSLHGGSAAKTGKRYFKKYKTRQEDAFRKMFYF